MKKIMIIILCFVFCVALIGCNKEKDDFIPVYKEITVMSFNIRILGLEDQPYKRWDARKQDVIELIMRHSPDIIGFQEVKDPQYEYLKENLTEYGFYGLNGWGNNVLAPLMGGANAIFYKKDRFDIEESSTLWLSDTPETCSPVWDSLTDFRTLAKVKLVDKLNKKPLTYINTHIALTAIAKEKTTQMLAAIAEETEGAIIVSGDFNYQQDSFPYPLMVEGVLADSSVLAPDTDTGGTFHSFNGTIDKPWPKPIDFIFITDRYFEALSYKIIRDHNEEGRYPSDHFPIKSIIKYKAS